MIVVADSSPLRYLILLEQVAKVELLVAKLLVDLHYCLPKIAAPGKILGLSEPEHSIHITARRVFLSDRGPRTWGRGLDAAAQTSGIPYR